MARLVRKGGIGRRLRPPCPSGGFTDQEVDDLLAAALEQCRKGRGDVELSAADLKLMVREWYNGYRFALGTERVYNPTLVFYFLLELLEEGRSPRQMLDSNLAVDEGKLEHIARLSVPGEPGSGHPGSGHPGPESLVDLIRKEEPLAVRELRDRFTLKELSEESTQDTSFIGSYLYYLGLLTLRQEETEQQTVELVVPNEVVHGLYVERIRKILMPLGASRSTADALLFAFLKSGDLEPLLDFVEATLFPIYSNRDARWANELTVKTLFMTLLWNATSYIVHSEPELDHRYADLCLLRRPDARASSLWDLLFAFVPLGGPRGDKTVKRFSLKELGMSGKDVKVASRGSLMNIERVKEALDDAEGQIADYRTALEKGRGDTLKLRSYAVVALGFERLVVRASRTSA